MQKNTFRTSNIDNLVSYNYNIIMENEIRFEWHDKKYYDNENKHNISFDEAKSVFYDEYAIVIADPDHSSLDEERFLILGYSSIANLLVVSHCYRGNDDVIRIISARKATNNEARQYRSRKGDML